MSTASVFENSTNVVIQRSTFNVAGGNMLNVASNTNDNRKKIFQWLNAPNPSPNYNAARELHCLGTGLWFLSGEMYNQWKVRGGSLIIYGLPGSGKTILCSTVIEDVMSYCKNAGSNAVYAYFIFDGRNEQDEFQLHHKFIRSLIWQFCAHLDPVPSALDDLFGKGHMQPSLLGLENTLLNILQEFTDIFILIDSFDECTEWQLLLKWIKGFTKQITGNIHLLGTSRPEIDILENMKQVDHVEVNMDKSIVNLDIRAYVDEKLNSSRKLRLLDNRKSIKSAILEQADGMFRLVAFRLGELESCLTPKQLQQSMKDLPRDLDAMYSCMISKINPSNRSQALAILQWLAFAARTLKLNEVAEVVAVDLNKDNPHFDSSSRLFDPQDVLFICGGLITHSADEVKLSHLSVKEYLISERRQAETGALHFNASLSHSFIAQSCLVYLLQCFSTKNEIYISQDFLLAKYAAQFWFFHAQSINTGVIEGFEYKLMMKLLLNDAAYANLLRLYNPDIYNNTISSLIYVSQLGLMSAAIKLLKKGANLNIQGGYYGNALQAASIGGHREIVQLLLKKGANPNAKGGFYGNALQAASSAGHREIVQLLFEKGASPDVQGGYYGNALQAASSVGHREIIQLLFEKGASPDIQGGYYGNALQAASSAGHRDIVQLLLEKGSSPEIQGGHHGSTLQAASVYGHKDIIQLLLEKNANTNIIGGFYGNPLQAASFFGHKDIVQLLLQNSANPNIQGGYFGSTLQAASVHGHKDIVQLLLNYGADPNIKGGFYGNALQAASLGGHQARKQLRFYIGTSVHQATPLGGHRDIIKLLLEKGADLNIQGGYYGSALQAASVCGYKDIAEILLEKGANINILGGNALWAAVCKGHGDVVSLLLENGAKINLQGVKCRNALQAASVRGHRDVVQILLEKFPNPNTQGENYYGEALQAASVAGHTKIVQLLLEKGADPNTEGQGYYGDALQAASHKGYIKIVQLLLEKGANQYTKGGFYGNALQAASFEGLADIVQLLLDKGVDPNIQGGYYGTALQAASLRCHRNIVKLLLKRGADPNIQGGFYGCALQGASNRGYKEIIQLLLEYDANPNIQGGSYGNSLQAALLGGHKDVVQLLLEKGADTSIQEEGYRYALEATSHAGYSDIVQLLQVFEKDYLNKMSI